MKFIKFAFFLIFLIYYKNITQAQNFDAISQRIEKYYSLNKDGSSDLRVIKEIKLFSYLSMSKFGETFILYNPNYQKLTINKAYTKTADGKIINAPKNAFNELLPSFATNVAAFNHLKEMVVVHTGTELGATIFVDYSIHSLKEITPALMGEEIVGDIVPVSEYIIQISTPVGMSLNYKLLNSNQQPEKKIVDSQERLEWKFLNLPPLTNEPFQSRISSKNPYLTFSTQTMIDNIEWLIRQNTNNQNLPISLTKKIDQIVKNNPNELTKVAKIHRLIASEISTSNIPFALTGYKTRSIDEIWMSNSATNLEKALLLSKSLNYAQITATPIVCFDNSSIDSKIGNLKSVTDILVNVMLANGDKIVLNPIQDSPFDRQYFLINKTALELKANGATFVFANKQSTASIIGVIDWNPEKKSIDFSMELVADNALNPCFEVINDSTKINKYINGINSTEVVKIPSLSFSNKNLMFKIEVAKQIESNKDKYFFLELPSYKYDFDSWNLPAFIQKREETFELPFSINIKQTFVINIPENYKMVNNELNKKISNSCGEIELKIVNKRNQIEIYRNIKITKKTISQNEYSDLKELFSKWQQRSLKTIIITEKNGL